jgi:Na(+)-translocating NADH:ubiquinone oxidoreductase C subunit
MSFNKDGHVFTIAFTFVCTVILVFPLTLAYVGTKPIADAYWLDQHIVKTLASMGLPADAANIQKARQDYQKLEKYTVGTIAKDSAGKVVIEYAPVDFAAIAADPAKLVLLPLRDANGDNPALGGQKGDDIINKALQDTSYTGNLPVFFYVTDVDGQKRFAGDFTGPGLWGNVSLAIGVNADGTELTGLRVLFNVETPGLGGRIGEPEFTAKFTGKKPAPGVGVVFNQAGANADNGFDAIAGATITSAAVRDTINQRALVLLKALIAQKGGSK